MFASCLLKGFNLKYDPGLFVYFLTHNGNCLLVFIIFIFFYGIAISCFRDSYYNTIACVSLS